MTSVPLVGGLYQPVLPARAGAGAGGGAFAPPAGADPPVAAGATGAPPAATQSLSARSLFAAQQMAQEQREKTGDAGPGADVNAFMAFQEMSTAEKYRAMILSEMGMTEESLEELPPEDREKIEEKIRRRIEELTKEDVERKTSLENMISA